MAKRDPRWQEQIKELDGHRCQITGAEENLHAHHLKRRGLGGRASRDELANGITLAAWIHQAEHDGQIKILEWDRDAGVLVVEDVAGVILDAPGMIPRERLWFYAGRLKAELEEEEKLVQALTGSDREIAHLFWRRWKNDNFLLLDPDAPSFRAYTEARDWPTNQAESLAELFELSRSCGVEWAEGETARAYRKRLRAAGVIAATERTFLALVFRDARTVERLAAAGDIQFVRATDNDFADSHCECIRVGKLFGLRKTEGGIELRNGAVVAVRAIKESE